MYVTQLKSHLDAVKQWKQHKHIESIQYNQSSFISEVGGDSYAKSWKKTVRLPRFFEQKSHYAPGNHHAGHFLKYPISKS